MKRETSSLRPVGIATKQKNWMLSLGEWQPLRLGFAVVLFWSARTQVLHFVFSDIQKMNPKLLNNASVMRAGR
jgi:hypothetical protein